ncbi:DUF6776 family protein [Oceanobacter mangrovi]|uniref:DUF6776 family protein n=1 Tax=Oceanobacter mangrovi TaxID=2862510 RepID=UPI001C8D0242|nr:DUF6776 family protein [Oceanobacter mangrovi]
MALQKGSVVKGSPQDELVIISHRRGYASRGRFMRFMLLLLVAGATFAATWFYHLESVRTLQTERDQLAQALNSSASSIDSLSQKVGVLEKGGEVDRQAADTVRGSIRSLEDQVVNLEEEVSFYKSIMDPAAIEKGLKIHNLDISRLDDGSFQYRLMLTQVADNANAISGQVTLTLVGRDDKGEAAIPLNGDTVAGNSSEFRFRYFQELAGNVRLPANFQPVRVEVIAEATGRKARRVEALFDWPQ